MWLIDVKTKKLKEFLAQPPPYAILSHRWNKDGEISFSNLRAGKKSAEKMHGYDKIRNTCKLAQRAKLSYVWIDTCCIDKTSSAELSESINSMFDWYRSAVVCLVYLSDIEGQTSADSADDSVPLSGKDTEVHISSSEWFRRVWTLQELLAPTDLWFYSKDWSFIGSRDSPFIKHEIYKATSIDEEYFLREADIGAASVAERMSWAAEREATRPEDVAYSLLGIFDINMPLLYGEGATRAFTRLQEAIISTQDDYTIFAWGRYHGYVDENTEFTHPSVTCWESPFATHPDQYKFSSGLVDDAMCKQPSWSRPFSINSKGVELQLPCVPLSWPHGPMAILRCRYPGREYANSLIAIKVHLKDGSSEVARVSTGFYIIHRDWLTSCSMDKRTWLRALSRNSYPISHIELAQMPPKGMYIRTMPPSWKVVKVEPASQWDPITRVIKADPSTPWCMAEIHFQNDENGARLVALCGYKNAYTYYDMGLWINIQTAEEYESLSWASSGPTPWMNVVDNPKEHWAWFNRSREVEASSCSLNRGSGLLNPLLYGNAGDDQFSLQCLLLTAPSEAAATWFNPRAVVHIRKGLRMCAPDVRRKYTIDGHVVIPLDIECTWEEYKPYQERHSINEMEPFITELNSFPDEDQGEDETKQDSAGKPENKIRHICTYPIGLGCTMKHPNHYRYFSVTKN